jgi:hypothetical protein
MKFRDFCMFEGSHINQFVTDGDTTQVSLRVSIDPFRVLDLARLGQILMYNRVYENSVF